MNPVHDAALEYARRGWHVFPIEQPRAGNPESGKRPASWLVPNGKDDATTDAATIDRWFSSNPDLNVGISLEPSNLIVLDVDVGKKPGAASLEVLSKEIDLELTLTAVTGGSGLHAFYRKNPDAPASQKIGFREGLDLIVRGYVVAAPSKHYSGGEYRWSQIRQPALLSPKLVAAANAPRKSPANSNGGNVADEAIPQGRRNDAMFRLGCSLRDSGIGPEALKSALHFENQRRFSPPLPDEELLQIAASVLQRVTPTRDAALGSVVEEIARSTISVEGKSRWVKDVAFEAQPPVRFYSTGFPQLDEKMGGGVCSRQVCGIIGSPSAGKSAFVGSVAMHLQTQIPVLHVSTELPRHELMIRYAAYIRDTPWRDGLKAGVTSDMRDAVKDLQIKLMGFDDYDRAEPIRSIALEAEALFVQTGKRPAIIIDYVQLLARGGGSEMRSKVGELTMAIRIMAQVLDCPVIAVFSTRRDMYGGGPKTDQLRAADDPTAYLAAAKESGDIEFDCATILYLDVDKLHEGLPKPARIAVARCRVGDIGFAGARAQLDVGKWFGDPSATVEMTADSRAEKKTSERSGKDEMRVLELILKMPERPWNEIRGAAGFSVTRADIAKSKLLEQGKIQTARTTYVDGMQRMKSRAILQITPGNEPPLLDVKEASDAD